MEKEKLRPLTYTFNRANYDGYFHGWVISKYSDNGEEYALALIERSDGTMIQVPVENGNIKFTDR